MAWDYFFLIFYILILMFGWSLTCLGFPGNWLMIISGFLYALVLGEKTQFPLALSPVFWAVGLAVVGEVAETLGGTLGLKKGGSRKAVIFSLVGSIAGGILGTFVGLPIPVLGSIVGIILFSGAGAFIGTWIGETFAKTDPKKIYEIAKASFVGRVFGSIAKIILGGIIFATLLFPLF